MNYFLDYPIKSGNDKLNIHRFYSLRKLIKEGRLLLIIKILLDSTLIAANSNYIIVENPATIQILNEYEQRLSREKQSLFPAYMPFRIITENDILSDSYTRAIKASCDGILYYLVKNNIGNLLMLSPGNSPLRITKAHTLTDTVKITRNNMVQITTNKYNVALAKNELIKLIFIKNNRYYVKQLAPSGVYGWISGNQHRYWIPFIREKEISNITKEFPSYLVNTIKAQFNAYNRILRELFIFFNKQENSHQDIPEWNLEVAGNKIYCRFEGISNRQEYQRSIRLIMRRLENILPQGMGHVVFRDNSLIIYYEKNQSF